MIKLTLLVIGSLIVAAMTGYAVYLLIKLQQQKKAFKSARMARVVRLKESIEIISKAMQSGDCDLSEGVLRLKMLLAPLGVDFSCYPAMSRLYAVVMDMPTHDAYKALKRQERMRLDLTRMKTEGTEQEGIQKELVQLLQDIEKIKE